MARILLTGGSGFIGSHLADRFVKDGHEVVAVDNFVTGDKKNVAHLLSLSVNLPVNAKQFRLIEADVSTDLETFKKNIGPNLKFDYVLHFACPASPIDFAKIPLEILMVDSIGTFNTLEIARESKARYIIASTSEIYGDPLVHPQTEDYWGNVNPIGERSCYDEAKRFAEATTMAYRRKYGVNIGIVRIFNTYGPRMRLTDGRVVPNLCGQALRNEPLTVYGEGNQTRSFCYVDDLVECIVRLTYSNVNEPVNIGNPSEYKIIEFAKVVLESVPQSKSKIEYRPLLHSDDPKQRKPDITRAQKHLNWSPKVDLKNGLQKTLDYFRTVL